MTTSQPMSLTSLVSLEDKPLSPDQLGYMNARAKSNAHDIVLDTFLSLAQDGKVTQAFLARRLNKKPEQISRWLGAPANWTLDTLSNLLAAMGYEPTFGARALSELKNGNYHHPIAGDSQANSPVIKINSTGKLIIDEQRGIRSSVPISNRPSEKINER